MKQSSAVAATTTPGSLLSQYQLLCAVIDAPWATRLDIKVTSHIIERYYAKHGNSRASLRYLEKATGATRPNIIDSVRRIAEQGVISVERQGIGTRPTEYGLNFDFAEKQKPFAKNKKPIGPSASGTADDTARILSGIPDDTSTDVPSGIAGNTSTSGIVHDTSCGIAGDTSTAASGIVHDTESYLRNVLTSTLTVSRNNDAPAVPTAPPVSGQEAHTAATAVDPVSAAGFPELWTVWPRKHQIAKARAAYKALAPDPALHATLVAQAAQWAAHYEQTATEPRYVQHLHNWLSQDRYLEDVPVPYENPKEAAIARKRENGPRKAKASKQETTGKSGLSPGTPQGRHNVSITGFDMTGGGFEPEQEFAVSFKIEDGDHGGKAFSHTFSIVSSDDEKQIAGQSLYASIRHATGVLEPEDTAEFHGKALVATVKPMGRIEYAAA